MQGHFAGEGQSWREKISASGLKSNAPNSAMLPWACQRTRSLLAFASESCLRTSKLKRRKEPELRA